MRLIQQSRPRTVALFAALLALIPTTVPAATTTANLNVTATVVANCTLTTGTVAFGNYDPSAVTAATAAGSVTVTCTKGQAFASISLGAGNNSTGTQRNMKDGATDALPYSLFKPTLGGATYSCVYTGTPAPWGDGTAATTGTAFVPSGSLTPGPTPGLTYPVCGQIAAGVNVPAASYTDIVVATLTF